MKNKGWLSLAGFVLLLFLIIWGGPFLSSTIDKNYRKKINENGIDCLAEVFLKKTHKGNTVHFKYYYKGVLYRNNEQNDSLFNMLNIGDTIYIKLDTTNPDDSYIIAK
jgi:hypothetical protein